MKKILSLFALLMTIVIGAKAKDITITWFGDISAASSTEPTGVYAGKASVADIVTVNDMTKSTTLTFKEVKKQGNYWVEFTSTTSATKNYFSVKDYLEFSISVPAGYNFTPTAVSALVGAEGTGNNGAQLFEEGKYPAEDAKNAIKKTSEGGTTLSIIPVEKTYNNATYTVRVYLGQNSKLNGINKLTITGTYEIASTTPEAAAITTQPSDTETNVGVAATLKVVATGNPSPEYQWYSCDDAEGTNAQPITDATSSTYTVTPEETGDLYFYVTVQNENNDTPIASNIVKVTVAPGLTETPTFTVYGNTVQLKSATDGAKIYYELDNADVKTSDNKVEYTGAFIPASSGTVYAYAEKDGFSASEVVSQAVTLSTVGDVVGELIATVQPESKSDATTVFNGVTISGGSADGRGVYAPHFKGSGTVTLTASEGKTIKSIKIYGTSNDASKIATITAGDGATVITTPAELMPRDITVGGVQTMSEVVVTVNEPAEANSVSFTLGRESRYYIEVYGEEASATTETITTDNDVATYVTKNALDFTGLETKAYVVTGVNDAKTYVTTEEVTTVPAGTALLIKGATVDVPVIASADAPETNLFKVSDGSVEGDASTIFAYSKSAKQFKKVNTGIFIPSGKCYLAIPDVSGDALSLDFDEDVATAINGIEAENEAVAPVKVIKNGKLYIGNYNVAGQQIK